MRSIPLREKDFAAIDVDALIEELDSVGGCERSAIENDLYQLLYHLLKLTHAPALDLERAGRQWRLSINESRRDIQRRIKRSPSLSGYPLEVLPEEYTDARRQAASGSHPLFSAVPHAKHHHGVLVQAVAENIGR
jgi:hypothetical protein